MLSDIVFVSVLFVTRIVLPAALLFVVGGWVERKLTHGGHGAH